MFVVTETTVSEKMVYLVGGNILEGVGPVRCVTWTHVRRRRSRVGGEKRIIASLLIRVAWDVGLGAVGAVGWDAGSRMQINPFKRRRVSGLI